MGLLEASAANIWAGLTAVIKKQRASTEMVFRMVL
jgi:hypothetical protein